VRDAESQAVRECQTIQDWKVGTILDWSARVGSGRSVWGSTGVGVVKRGFRDSYKYIALWESFPHFYLSVRMTG
jgi:hypothetical protein